MKQPTHVSKRQEAPIAAPFIASLAAPATHDADYNDDNDVDENAVDISHLQPQQAPSEARFQRFQFLHRTYRLWQADLRHNIALVRSYESQMDHDTRQLFEKDFQATERELQLMKQEMAEIYRWFRDVYQEKEALYEHLQKFVKDRRGQMARHFDGKKQQLHKYVDLLKTIMEQEVEVEAKRTVS
jgi:inhibitor of KinA sporulation pathway (predicted exonuclease)